MSPMSPPIRLNTKPFCRLCEFPDLGQVLILVHYNKDAHGVVVRTIVNFKNDEKFATSASYMNSADDLHMDLYEDKSADELMEQINAMSEEEIHDIVCKKLPDKVMYEGKEVPA